MKRNKERMIIIRAFIGIDFPDEIKNNILKLQQSLRRYALKGRWKYVDNFHLTLKFLDKINISQKEKLDEAMKTMVRSMEPFSLWISGLGIFESRNSIRVLWVGLSGEILKLKTLQKNIDSLLKPIGFQPEKRSYTPHITIGQDILLEQDFNEIKAKIGKPKFSPIIVENLYLFKSEQIQNKRVYTKVSEYTLSL